jgi:Streptomycin adenylyltransferase
MSGADDRWAATVSEWAHAQADIKALVQIGSRVQPGAQVDAWSDFDYHLITSRPEKYRDGSFTRQLGSCWAVGTEAAFGNVVKLTAVFEGALEADFVVLRHAEVLIACAALRWPVTHSLWPAALRAGIGSLRRVAGDGWKVLKGGDPWTERYARVAPIRFALTLGEFERLCGQFWVQLVWAAKKAERGEWIASQRTVHRYLIEDCLRLCEEEARLEGRPVFPLGRRAEAWFNPQQLRSWGEGTRPDRKSLFAVLTQVSGDFARSSRVVAAQNGWASPDYREVREWLAVRAGAAANST